MSGLPVSIIAYMNTAMRINSSFLLESMAWRCFILSPAGKKIVSRIQIYTLFEPLLGFSPGIAFLWESKNKKGMKTEKMPALFLLCHD